MASLLDALAGAPKLGPFGKSDRCADWTNAPVFDSLSAVEQRAVNEVCRGERHRAVIVCGGRLYLFEHDASVPFVDGRRFGYTCRQAFLSIPGEGRADPVPRPPASTPKSLDSGRPDGRSPSRAAVGVSFGMAVGIVLACAVSPLGVEIPIRMRVRERDGSESSAPAFFQASIPVLAAYPVLVQPAGPDACWITEVFESAEPEQAGGPVAPPAEPGLSAPGSTQVPASAPPAELEPAESGNAVVPPPSDKSSELRKDEA